jgi:hypothetical protein
MPEEFCEFHDMAKSSCEHGQPQAGRTRLAPVQVFANGPTIEATQNGPCAADCGSRIVEGQRITHVEEGWAHEDCVADDDLMEGIA